METIDRIAALGYGAIELMADEPHAWPPTTTADDRRGIRARLRKCDLKISNINAFMMNAVQDFWHPSWIEPDVDYRRQRVQHTIDSLQLAADIGAPSITTEPGGPLEPGMEREKALDIFAEGLTQALRRAEDLGIMLLVEPEPELLIENADQFAAFAERIDSRNFGLNFDIGHFYCVGDPLPETVRRLAGYTKHYHIEDIATTRVHEHLIPGHGAIKFGPALKAIHDTGYRGWITVELYPYLDDPDAAGREAMGFLSEHLPA